ncbi:MAG: VacJ family lipoprotein [Nitrospirales bacterium]|nr:VacJ family lipoprotein [Nitrospirales bacterium]
MKSLLKSRSIFDVGSQYRYFGNFTRQLPASFFMTGPYYKPIRNLFPTQLTVSCLFILLFCMTLGLGGCAGKSKKADTQGAIQQVQLTNPDTAEEPVENGDGQLTEELFDPFAEEDRNGQVEEYDPIEPVNSAIFEFNYRLDKYVVKPAAKVYNFFIPPDVQQSIANVFQNIRFVPRLFNNLFQGKLQGAGIEMSRFLINTTLGVGGLFDPAGIMFGLQTPPEDLGQTLGKYGVPNGPYLMLPLLGPFTLRDSIGFIGDSLLDPFNWLVLPFIEIADAPRLVVHDSTIALSRLGLQFEQTVNARALSLEQFQGVEDSTLDLYGAVRNAYYQQRFKAIQE